MKGRATISVIPHIWTQFSQVCDQLEVNKSETIQELIEAFIAQHKQERHYGDSYDKA